MRCALRHSAFLMVIGALACSPALERSAHATEVGNARRFGLGLGLGEPTGIVGKYFITSEQALDFGFSFSSFWGRCYDGRHYDYCDRFGRLSVNMDYLWQSNIARGTARLDWHIGIGGRIWFLSGDDRYRDFAAGVRMPLGLDLTFDRPPFLEVFFELSPILYVAPAADFNVEPLIGVRFYF